MILITGATGHLGGVIIQHLLQKLPAHELAAFVRDTGKAAHLTREGISLRTGNYNDTGSLDNAMQGIDNVLLIAGGDAANGLQQHQNVVDAAKKAKVRCIAYTSRSLKDRNALANQLMIRHFQTEDYIKASGLNYILFRNILYMDTIPLFTGPAVMDTGIALPTGDGKVAFALRSEMGEAIANVLAQPGFDKQVYTFTGSTAYSFRDVAESLTTLSGKTVGYTPVEPSDFASRMKQRGIPDAQVQRMLDFMTDIKNGQEEAISPDLERILGRKPASLEDGLKTFYQL